MAVAVPLPEQVAEHGRWLVEHERRLNIVEPKIDSLRVDVAKLFLVAMLATVVLSIVANALVVHYLTPTQQTPTSVSQRNR